MFRRLAKLHTSTSLGKIERAQSLRMSHVNENGGERQIVWLWKKVFHAKFVRNKSCWLTAMMVEIGLFPVETNT